MSGLGPNWPDYVVAPYVDVGLWPPFDYLAVIDQIGCLYFNLAFIVAGNGARENYGAWAGVIDTTPGSGPGGSYMPFDKLIQSIQAKGGNAAISFGGAAGVPLHQRLKTVELLEAELRRILQVYPVSRVDFDIEGASIADFEATQRLSEAVRRLQTSSHPQLEVWLTLPAMPSGLTSDGLEVVRIFLRAHTILRGVNLMAMNYGASFTERSMGDYAIECATSTHGQLKGLFSSVAQQNLDDAKAWNLIGLTPMLGINDVQDNIFRLEDAHKVAAFAKQKRLGMVSFWSLQRDRQNVSNVCDKDLEFTKILLSEQ